MLTLMNAHYEFPAPSVENTKRWHLHRYCLMIVPTSTTEGHCFCPPRAQRSVSTTSFAAHRHYTQVYAELKPLMFNALCSTVSVLQGRGSAYTTPSFVSSTVSVRNCRNSHCHSLLSQWEKATTFGRWSQDNYYTIMKAGTYTLYFSILHAHSVKSIKMRTWNCCNSKTVGNFDKSVATISYII